jgi:hypothetical protein
MRKTYTLIKNLVAIIFITISGCLHAQIIEIVDANNFSAAVGIRGSTFGTEDTLYNVFMPFSEVPKGAGSPTFSYSNLVISGIDENGKHHFAGNDLLFPLNRYLDGPIKSNYDSAYNSFFRRVFKITRIKVTQHQAMSVPVPENAIDPLIKYWPALGNPYIATRFGVIIESPLAPFVDVDGNNSYNPAMGDYPAFCGDQAIFSVFNDEHASHDSTAGSNHLGIEIRRLTEEFLLPGESLSKNPVNNAVYVHYEIENKSANNFLDFYVSMVSDPDVGCFNNDAIGCDTNRHLAYAYNRTAFDNDCVGIKGYKNLHIATGVELLNERLSSFGYITNGGTFDLLNTDSSFYYALRGRWADGVPYTVGGTGRGGTIPTKFIYPGTPTDLSTWSEVSAATQMGDRRFLACNGPVVFAQGQVKTFDYAFFASYDSTSTAQAIVDTLRRDADIVQSFYNNTVVPCRAEISTAIGDVNNRLLQVMVYPNPASSQLVVQAPEVITTLQLTNLLGQVVFTAPGNSTKQVVDVSGMPKGIYLLKIKADVKEAVKKVVVE